MVELEQDNPDEVYVWVNDNLFIFSIFKFSLITDLNCTDNTIDFEYLDSPPSVLMEKYSLNKIS